MKQEVLNSKLSQKNNEIEVLKRKTDVQQKVTIKLSMFMIAQLLYNYGMPVLISMLIYTLHFNKWKSF